MNLTPLQEKAARAGMNDKEYVQLEQLQEINESLKVVAGGVITVKGEKGDKGDDGAPGKDGKDGKTPVKGVDYFDGKDGKTPSPTELAQLIEPMIPPAVVVNEEAMQNSIERKLEKNLPQFGTAFRDGLELLQDGERLDVSAIKGIEELKSAIDKVATQTQTRTGWGAHPLAVQQSGSTKVKVARTLNFTGATVTQSANGVTTIAIVGGSGWTVETPTGTVNGVNNAFTVTATPQYIVVDGITYFENDGYTLSGLNVTTTVPPTGFIRSIF